MSSPVVTIEDCTVSQIVGQETFEIAKGTLSLEQLTDPAVNAVLLIKIAESSFALPVEKDAIVGTKGDRSYVFSKKLDATSAAPPSEAKTPAEPAVLLDGAEGDLKDVPLNSDSDKSKKTPEETVLLVQIDMPTTASESNLTKFEKCLVEHQFLLVGPQADADNLSRAFLEWTGIKTKDLSAFTAQKTAGDSTTQPTQFSDTTHSTAASAASGSTTLAEATAKVGETIDAAVASIGSFIGSKLGTKGMMSDSSESTEVGWKRDTKEAIQDGADTVGIAAAGLAQGVKHAGAEVSNSASKVVEHNYGDDALKLKGQVDTTLQNVGSVGATALRQSSTIAHGVTATQGAVSEE